MRSRTVRRPAACWRATRSSPPISLASASRRRSSSSSGSQLIEGGRYWCTGLVPEGLTRGTHAVLLDLLLLRRGLGLLG